MAANSNALDFSGMCSCNLGHALRSTKTAATIVADCSANHRNGQERKHSGAAGRNGVSE